jgi:hypothetical protein
MRLAFIPSAYRTIFAHALAGELEKAGHDIYWVSPNRRWANWLRKRDIRGERILDITDFGPEWRHNPEPTPQDIIELRGLEQTSGWSIYDLILMDDLLSRRPTPYAVRYLAVCARRVRDFMQKHGIQAVSGELTWAFELIVGQVCCSLGVPFLRPTPVRIPDSRFAFFSSHLEKDILRFRGPTDDERHHAREILLEYRRRLAPPAYMSMNWSVLRLQWSRIRLLVKHVLDLAGDPFDETSLRPLPLIGKYLGKGWRVRRNRWFGPFQKATLPPPRPFVLVTLHLEPEATINVMGSPFCNQIELVRAMVRTLPVTHDLWVKEHRVALPNRTPRFYWEVTAIPGVRLIDPFASSQAIIPYADLVLAVTGTACYEAALLGRASVTLAPTAFSPIVVSDHFNPFSDSLEELLDQTRGSPSRSVDELVEFLADLLAQSWPGSVGDALWEPTCMQPENVQQVTTAFCAALQMAVPVRRLESVSS